MSVNAQQASIDSGLIYLQTTQSLDGSWGGAPTSLNTILQTTSTTARTFQFLGLTDPALTKGISFLSTQTPITVDDLAQELEVLSASGAVVSNLVTTLKAAQQSDGGWGIDPDKTFPSETIDTVSALRALNAAGAADTTTVSQVLAYLLSRQNPDGGWGLGPGSPSHAYYTSMTLLALKDFQATHSLDAQIVAAGDFLATQQNPDGSFGSPAGESFATALALQAMLRTVVATNITSSALNYLLSSQLTNGSWDNDPYGTALVLRALQDAQTADQDIDNDGDGFTERTGDCNDADANIHPGALDLTLNGIDEDCNGLDGPLVGSVDADADGFATIEGDCNDTDPDIHPGAIDPVGDGIDQDCNGLDGPGAASVITSAELMIEGAQSPSTVFSAYDTVVVEVNIGTPDTLVWVIIVNEIGEKVLTVGNSAEGLGFNTKNLPPGAYTLNIVAYSAIDFVVKEVKSLPFTIQGEFGIDQVFLGTLPQFSHVGGTEAINVILLFANRSNISSNLSVDYKIQSPTGAILVSGVIPVNLPSTQSSLNLTLTNFTHTFTESGLYPIEAKIFDGPTLINTVASEISVAPGIRIDPSHTLSPQAIPPGEDQQIRIDIRLEGVEQAP